MTLVAAQEDFHESSIASILEYVNLEVVNRIAEEEKISSNDAKELFQDTLRFLYLCDTQKKRFSPSKKIDKSWHIFLLYTKDYADFCQGYLSRFIHHVPTRKLSKDTFVNTLPPAEVKKVAESVFGFASSNWDTNMANSHDCDNDCAPDYDCANDPGT